MMQFNKNVCVCRRRHHPPLTTQEPARRSITTDRRIGQTDRQTEKDRCVCSPRESIKENVLLRIFTKFFTSRHIKLPSFPFVQFLFFNKLCDFFNASFLLSVFFHTHLLHQSFAIRVYSPIRFHIWFSIIISFFFLQLISQSLQQLTFQSSFLFHFFNIFFFPEILFLWKFKFF